MYFPFILRSPPYQSTIVVLSMEAEEYTLPVPNTIEIKHKDCRKMDDYVMSFPATQHGYRMRIGHSQPKSSPVSTYECYRSGYPKGQPAALGTTKSLRIGCPLELTTRYIYSTSSWILIHTHVGHNHPPDPSVKPRKRHIDPKAPPILAPGVVWDASDGPTSTPVQDQDQEQQPLALVSNQYIVPPLQDEWLAIRQSMQETIITMPNILTPRALPEPRDEALARLATTKKNVIHEQKYWLTMPGWGGIIATTFNRPVIYYEPGISNNRIFFPYHTSPNLTPPIVIIYADFHFASALLDFTLDRLPVPRVCPTWQRFATAKASIWLDDWKSLIQLHADFLNNRKPRTRRNPKDKKVPQEPTVVSD
ncbi:uncharacterized protein MELLADRAFT_114051 [Melampsora larici-populina 98AG31]|uniref:Uncharacterized protein n=1 Tax=Melampsora larici-populina (strain 98AG31 / pathotype 3-4-7) TaxID=747676 RepID=F4SBZ9_MELLP|nr:uncharacterized protein MELLADRAFT_114051 [Melampsora larici-populina 98AG31]EGF97828.1 hypothetical protein MELLADRAFT_114051 [Melampsora larici-populina 98AG31]